MALVLEHPLLGQLKTLLGGIRAQSRGLRADRLVLLLPGRAHPGVDRRTGHRSLLPAPGALASGFAAAEPTSRRPRPSPPPHGGRKPPPPPPADRSPARPALRSIPLQELGQGLGHHRGDRPIALMSTGADLSCQRFRQLDGEATRTGLPPAGDDELPNSNNTATSRCRLLFCRAHGKGSL